MSGPDSYHDGMIHSSGATYLDRCLSERRRVSTAAEMVIHKDDVGWYVAMMRPDGTYVRRTLSITSERKADRWAIRASCHGFSAHTSDCPDCETT